MAPATLRLQLSKECTSGCIYSIQKSNHLQEHSAGAVVYKWFHTVAAVGPAVGGAAVWGQSCLHGCLHSPVYLHS